MPLATIDTPIGRLGVVETDDAITRLIWNCSDEAEPSPLLELAKEQVRAYFAGALDRFDLPLAPDGSEFQRAVWDAMLAIPLGQTRTYGDLAVELGHPAQAVGQACGANPIPVIIPCHRIVGTQGLGGFSGMGGVEMKVQLLRHEGAYSLLL